MKKNYINPEVAVLQFAGTSLMAGSAAPGGDTGPSVNVGNMTDDQW